MRLVERTKAGLARARREGKQLGRPRAEIDLYAALLLRRRGLSIAQAARKLGVGRSTLHRAYQAHDAARATPVPETPRAEHSPADV